mmetsp:Transcript_19162/g.33761  ORF Transcript_19162/g.33761 Transcript_19162/m.33761 type:complete len:473 (-) Transcript_19162:48-1466(-)
MLLVMLPLALYMTVFSIQAVMVLIPNVSPSKFLVVILFGLAVCGTCGAIATSGIVATGSLFPSHIGVNPFFSGQAVGGVAVSLVNFLSATVEDPSAYFNEHCSTNPQNHSSFATSVIRHELEGAVNDSAASCSPYQTVDWAVFSYFLSGCIVLLLCLVGFYFIHLYKLREFRDEYEVVHDNLAHREEDGVSPRIGLELNDRVQQRSEEEQKNGDSRDHRDFLLNDAGKMSNSTEGDALPPPPAPTAGSCVPTLCTGDSNDDAPCDNANGESLQENFDDEFTDELDEVAVFSAVKGPAACIFLTFTVTLSLFPSWVSELRSSHECQSHFRLSNDLYIPFSFLFFNIGDLVGRMWAERISVEHIPHLSKKLVLGAMLRGVFFPLFLMCLTTFSGESSMVIRSDFFSLLVQFLFAVSNGLLVSTSFMWSPHLVAHTAELQERAGEVMTFALSFGLLSGSLLAFPFLQLASQILQK